MTENNPLLLLKELGQNVWVDYIDCNILNDGTLRSLIDRDGVTGMTSNPGIFERAITHSDAYDKSIAECARNGLDAKGTYESLALEDVRRAAEILLSVYEISSGRNGYVSLEVSPLLAHDTRGTVVEAQRLWTELAYPNVMIKVPATREGIPAIRELTAGGINVNATLIFSATRYREAAEAYIGGVEDRLANGGAIDALASVASFFVGRVDAKVDGLLEAVCVNGEEERAEEARSLQGEIAVAWAASAYRTYTELYAGERWVRLAEQGARRQRLVWAATGTVRPGDSDVKYVEALIGPDTVTTLPLETLSAFRHHGETRLRVNRPAMETAAIVRRLERLDIDMNRVAVELEEEGVRRFVASNERLLDRLDKRLRPPEQNARPNGEQLP